jgi:hypothetical protein
MRVRRKEGNSQEAAEMVWRRMRVGGCHALRGGGHALKGLKEEEVVVERGACVGGRVWGDTR